MGLWLEGGKMKASFKQGDLHLESENVIEAEQLNDFLNDGNILGFELSRHITDTRNKLVIQCIGILKITNPHKAVD